MKIIFSEEADLDLLQIHTYLGMRNRTAAVSLASTFNKKFESLSRYPFIGRERFGLGPGLRSVLAENYVIFYRVEPNRVLIVRVLDGRRDIDAEFQH